MLKKALRHLALLTFIGSAGLAVAPSVAQAQDWHSRGYQNQRDRSWHRDNNYRRDWHRDNRYRNWDRRNYQRDAWRYQRWNAPYYRGYRPYVRRPYVPRNGFYFGFRY